MYIIYYTDIYRHITRTLERHFWMRDDSSQGGPSPKGSRLKACQGRPLPVPKGKCCSALVFFVNSSTWKIRCWRCFMCWAILIVISHSNCTYNRVIIYHISIGIYSIYQILSNSSLPRCTDPDSLQCILYAAASKWYSCKQFILLPSGDMIPVAIRASKQGKKSRSLGHMP